LAATTTVATAMARGTDNNQLKSAAKTRWQWRQQFVDDDEDDDNDDDDKHDKHDDNNNKDDKQDDEDDEHDERNDNEHDNDDHDDDNVDNDDHDDDDNKANTATAVGGDDNCGNSNGQGHRQQSTKIGSKDTVAVATAIR
jgi:hypothetical protein